MTQVTLCSGWTSARELASDMRQRAGKKVVPETSRRSPDSFLAVGLVQALRDYIAEHQTQIDALQILYRRPLKQRLTEPMLKEREKS